MIELQHLSKSYGPTVAISDLTVTVRPGHVTGFLGPNGAGKSTTMRLVLGLDRPDHGRALVNGRPYRELHRPLREVGAALDVRGIQGGRRARDHLRALARSNGLPSGRVAEVLGQVGLESVADRRTNGLSLGMLQRLAIASALIGDPPVLLFDEPLNGLDSEGIRWVRSLMHELAGQGRTVLVSSHLLSEMQLTADHVIVIGRGRLLADTTMLALLASGARATIVRSPDAVRLADAVERSGGQAVPDAQGALRVTGLNAAQVGDVAHAAGLRVHELSDIRSTLEEVFSELTIDDLTLRTSGAPTFTEEIR